MDHEPNDTREIDEPRCPKCGEGTPLHIAYGLPSHGMFEASSRGEIALGGCCMSYDSPSWQCRACGHAWGGPPTQQEVAQPEDVADAILSLSSDESRQVTGQALRVACW